MDTTLCTLQDAAGRVERCPGRACPFWDDDGCVIAGARPELYRNPPLVTFLLDLRREMGGASPMFSLLPPGLRD